MGTYFFCYSLEQDLKCRPVPSKMDGFYRSNATSAPTLARKNFVAAKAIMIRGGIAIVNPQQTRLQICGGRDCDSAVIAISIVTCIYKKSFN